MLRLAVLSALVFFLIVGSSQLAKAYPAQPQAPPAQVTKTSQSSQQLPPWVSLGGGCLAGGGLGAWGKEKLNELLQKSQDGLLQQDYTACPQYVNDRIQGLEVMLKKLSRRFNYMEKGLIRHLPKYQCYGDSQNLNNTNH
ncbi:hypothetical protein [Crocosphaera sp. Alani8]|uniref:hypothetical protein n=1 Tax=Crocosphaera sp. Alani8 TaxID=3038952 RepID=UPI00313ED320